MHALTYTVLGSAYNINIHACIRYVCTFSKIAVVLSNTNCKSDKPNSLLAVCKDQS